MTAPATSVPAQTASASRTLRRLSLRWAVIVFAVALAMRGGWGMFRLVRQADPSILEFPDEQQYWLIASSLRAGEGLRDEFGFRATRMPLYPAYLSLFAGSSGGVVAAKVTHWVLGASVAVLAAGVATTLLGNRHGITAGLLVACDPFLVFFSSLLLTETLFLVGLLAFWWSVAPFAVRRGDDPAGGSAEAPVLAWPRWVAAGLAAAVCVYVRESALGLIILVLVLIVFLRRLDGRMLGGAAVATGLVVVSLLPWAARNRQVLGEWCWLTTRSGVSLYDGVGPQATGASNLAGIQQMPAVERLHEVAWNRYFLRESLKSIASDPGRIVGLAGRKLARTWNPFPNVETYQLPLVRALSAVWMLTLYFLVAVGSIVQVRKHGAAGTERLLFLLIPAMYFSALHSLFVGSVRYRLAAIPMLEILAAAGLIVLFSRLASWKAGGRATHHD